MVLDVTQQETQQADGGGLPAKTVKLKRAYSVSMIMNRKLRTMDFTGDWLAACGKPEPCGSWIIYGATKNGKTSFCMLLAKQLSQFGKVYYDSIEEGVSLSIKEALSRYDMQELGSRFLLLDKEDVEDLKARRFKRQSADFIIFDSVQFAELKFSEYKQLKALFPDKLFIYVSHIDNGVPAGLTARKILRDANIAFKVEGFKAFPVGRYGGGEPLVICQELSENYWFNKLNK
jgi:hypothetical protein